MPVLGQLSFAACKEGTQVFVTVQRSGCVCEKGRGVTFLTS